MAFSLWVFLLSLSSFLMLLIVFLVQGRQALAQLGLHRLVLSNWAVLGLRHTVVFDQRV